MDGCEVDPWLERFEAGDGDAAHEARRLVARIVAFRGFGVPPPEQEELVQETLSQVWQAIAAPGFDRAQSFEAFVRTVASRRCVDWHRVRRVTIELSSELESRGSSPEAALLDRERVALGRRLIAALGHGCRELIRLHAMENLTYAEIAARWGRSEGALRVQMSQCLARARVLFRRLREQEGAAS